MHPLEIQPDYAISRKFHVCVTPTQTNGKITVAHMNYKVSLENDYRSSRPVTGDDIVWLNL